jgi:subtilase family serine protease
LTLTGTARTARSAFGVGLSTRTVDGVRLRRTTGTPQLPAAVAGDVRAVAGLSQQVAAPLHAAALPLAAGADGQYCSRFWAEWNKASVPQQYPAGQQSNIMCGYTGPQLRALYGLADSDRGTGQTVVIVGAFNSATALSDANTAFAANGVPTLPANRYTVKDYPITGGGAEGCDATSWHVEQALDIQAVHTIAPDASIVYVAAPDCTTLPDALAAVVADASVDATIISNSWGIIGEPSDTAYLTATNTVLTQAAILGIGTYFASGDSGDNSSLAGSSGPSVLFPASSPWTTAVGGTSSALGANNQVLWQTGWESAANGLTGGAWQRLSPPFLAGAGGGVSQRFDKPSWQTTSGTMRSVPDVAALADPYTGFRIGYTAGGSYASGTVGGTSLAAPIVAALVAVAQARAGGADIGLLTPVLYAKAANTVVTDVQHVAAGIWAPGISASQTGDFLLDLDAGVQSLSTGAGYDPVTGLGVPGPGFVSGIVS